jgi:peptide/nickel transport system substrate-binding protein
MLIDRLRKSRWRGIAAAALTAVTVAATTGPAIASELRIGVSSHPDTLALDETGNDAAQFLYNIYDTLIERDVYSATPKFKPGLALSWTQISPTVTELTLRPGVTMHDGRTMTAEDVVFSLNRVFESKDPRFATAKGRFFDNFAKAETAGDMTVRVITHRPEPLFNVLISSRNAGITSKAYVEEMGPDKAALKPIGTGPYKVVEVKANRETILDRFDGYWGAKAPVDRIRYLRVGELAARVTALVNGELDFITNIPPDQAKLIPTDKFTLVGTTWPMFHVVVLNMSDPVLKDVRIRRAMNLAIDRAALTNALWGKEGIPAAAHQFTNYGEPLYIPGLKTIKYDVAEAKRLVKESGYNGQPIRISFQPNYYLYFDLAAQAMADMWSAIGLNAKIEQVEKYDYKTLQMRPWSNPMYYPDPMGAFDTHWSKASWTTTRKMFQPQNPEWDKLYETARFETDPMKRRDAYKQLITIGEEEAGWILLYQPHEYFAMRKGVEWKIPVGLRPYALTFRDEQIKLGAK